MKKWHRVGSLQSQATDPDAIIAVLLKNRGLHSKKDIDSFLHPPDPNALSAKDVGIDKKSLKMALTRIQKAIDRKESIVVYADYDADGITAGAVMWESLYQLGARVMPYIPHRIDEGYGLSLKGIDAVKKLYNPALIVTVDHGITAWEKVAYAKTLGIDVIITDHHVKPDTLPDCTIVHTTQLSGAGVSWFVAKEVILGSSVLHRNDSRIDNELLALASIGTIADMVPLVGPNRSIAKYGLEAINKTERVGLLAILAEAGLTLGKLSTYDVSHIVAPRLNAMGRIVHAMDALRLLCTKNRQKATDLAQKLGLTNKERQQLTIDTTLLAVDMHKGRTLKGSTLTNTKLIFLTHESFNQGVIGLVAGKLVEEFYLPSVVVSLGEEISKASARSIAGFNIVEAIRSCSDILIDVGGHPMAAGFTVETKHLPTLQKRLEQIAQKELDQEKLTRVLRIDTEIPFESVTDDLWQRLRDFEPFGFGNPEPVFATKSVTVEDARLVGSEGKHLKLRVRSPSSKLESFNSVHDAIAFGMGRYMSQLVGGKTADIAYTIDMNVWNGNSNLQLKIRDIHI